MKRTLLMIAAFALLLTQCRKPAVELPTAGPANENMVSMTVTVGHGRTLIGTDGTITWSEGDKLYVGDGEKYIGFLTLEGNGGSATGTFTGSVSTTSRTTFGFYYLGSNPPEVTSGETSVDISFASQTGVLTDASSCHIGYGTATGKVEDGKVILNSTDPVTMTSKVAIAYFKFKKDDDSGYTGAITLSGANICNSMTVGFNGSFSGTTGTEGNAISLTNTESSRKYVMLVPPATVVEETLEFGGGAEGSTKFYKGIEANKFYCLGEGYPIAVSVTPWEPTWVDFGLSVKWATCNLGATSPGDYGDYYAWGATETWYSAGGQTSSPTWKEGYSDGYSWAHCPFTNGAYSYSNKKVFTKYVPQSQASTYGYNDFYDNKTTLESSDDAATQAWGEGWRMPTKEEWKSLYDSNTFEWLAAGATSEKVTSFTAVAAGYLVIKGKDLSLDPTVYMFLPAAGSRSDASLNDSGSNGGYWSSSLEKTNPFKAGYVLFTQSGVWPTSALVRGSGCQVRPVCLGH